MHIFYKKLLSKYLSTEIKMSTPASNTVLLFLFRKIRELANTAITQIYYKGQSGLPLLKIQKNLLFVNTFIRSKNHNEKTKRSAP